jgi:type II secretory pathway component PulF
MRKYDIEDLGTMLKEQISDLYFTSDRIVESTENIADHLARIADVLERTEKKLDGGT